MLIKSQDKTKIINIKNVSVIDFFSMNGVFAISVKALDVSCSIAEYSTKAKALKVLDMIQEAYINGHIDYQMPEDSEVEVDESWKTHFTKRFQEVK